MNVLITGATGGLGKTVLDQFTDHTCIVITSPGKVSALPKGVFGFEADLTNETDVNRVVAAILREHKTIDAAVLLVGGFVFGGIDQADGTAVKNMIDINFNTAYFVTRPIFQQMKKQGSGRIVLVGSRPAIDAKAGKQTVAYALSKSLIFTLAELLNAEGSERNVVASVVVPSTIDTPANRASMPDADFSKWVRPKEIAELIDVIISTKAKSLRAPVFKIYGDA